MLPFALAGPENGCINAGAVLSSLSSARLTQPLRDLPRPRVFKLDPRHLTQTWQERVQRGPCQIEVLPKWKEKVQARNLRALQVQRFGMESNVLFSQVGQDCVGQWFVEGQPLVTGGQDVRVDVGWMFACTAITEVGPSLALEGDLPKDLPLLESVLSVKPSSISVFLAGKHVTFDSNWNHSFHLRWVKPRNTVPCTVVRCYVVRAINSSS
jgi:hypothetical protein